LEQMKLNALLQEVLEEAGRLDIPVSKKIQPEAVVNGRAKQRFGCCKQEGRGRNRVFKIEISAFLLSGPEASVRQTLAHEVLHTCPGCSNHGDLWKKYADQMNRAYGYNIRRTASHEALGIETPAEKSSPRVPRYILVCEKCGTRFFRVRMCPLVQYPHRYRCGCGGRLKRIK